MFRGHNSRFVCARIQQIHGVHQPLISTTVASNLTPYLPDRRYHGA